MKKLYLLFALLPLVMLAQTPLVKWYQADFSPTIIEDKVVSSKVTRMGGTLSNTSWGDANVFYNAEGWPNTSSINLSQYIQFTVSPQTGYKINLSSFVFNARSQWGAGSARMEVRYSKTADFASYTKLLDQTLLTAAYKSYKLNFPVASTVNTGETMYIRVYQYNTNSNLHIEHNLSGSLAPTIAGSVVLEQPKKPKAEDDRIGTEKNKPVTALILDNDDYQYSGALSAITTTTTPKNGSVTVNGVKDITYTPNPGFVGYDSFHYTLTNAVGLSNTAKVEVQVVESMSGTPITLVRWNKYDLSATNYSIGVKGVKLAATGVTLEPERSNQPPFKVSGLPTPQEFNGSPDESKYIAAAITSNPDYTTYLKSFSMKYRGNGGNMTIAYSKTADFSGKTDLLVNEIAYTNDWVNQAYNFPEGTILYPGETLYLRIYNHNTWNVFYIDFLQNGSVGPAITGISSPYVPEPCSKTVTWSGSEWLGGRPDINKKIVLNGDYDTSKNGIFESCSITLTGGKIIVAPGNSLTVYNEINVSTGTAIEIQNDANLIQLNDDAPANSGNITVMRDIKIGAGRTQYNYLGSPVAFAAGQSLKTIYPGIDFALYYNEANNFFYSSSGANIPGRGLAVKEPNRTGVAAVNTKVTAVYKGVPQNGRIDFPLANSNTATNNSYGFNLIGNPYASNIDLQKLYDLNGGNVKAGQSSPNISATFYFWDNEVNGDVATTQQGSAYSGQAYAVYNALAGNKGTGTAAAGYLNNKITGTKVPTNIVKTGQGFMTKALVKNYTLKYSNSIRTNGSNSTAFFGKAQNQEMEDDRYWLKLITPSNLTSTLAVVYFEGGKKGFGEEDSESKGGSDDIFTMVDDKKLAINGREGFNPDDRVVLGSQYYVSGNYTIALEKAEGTFADTQSVYLKDRQTGIITNLSQGSYTFSANAGTESGRFEIIYRQENVLAVDAQIAEELVIYRDGGDYVVKAQSKKITRLELYDTAGRLIYKTNPNSLQAVISGASLSSGMYILKTNQYGIVTAKKIVK